MNNSTIGICVALGVSFFFLYTRKKKWQNPKIVWLICFGLLLLGISGFVISNTKIKRDLILYYGFCIPIIYWFFDRLFKTLSFKIQNRDFILYLKGSDEIDSSLGGKNPHVKESDILFSFGLLIIIVLSTLIGVLILR
ncbi:hypothetical protein C7447_101283 [Tenacibaculum adriaticum]|uniref:Uncharacterized protein n=1 Tax=Tenacibaculum adriaticum TaxID=413713 RepID=A0A5S5DYL4_9FLAO|nr:hypothetical protein [Tenacibaculum adriaticum]TYP99679.1 hypothetical protein C7447_101283 [Tenacibaculum adriaticum]